MCDPDQMRRQLRRAILDLRERGINVAARWAAEQLAGLPAPDSADAATHAVPATSDSDAYQLALSLLEAKVCESMFGAGQTPILVLAACFTMCCLQEYRRAAHTLSQESGSKAVFLRSYATYLAGEKRKQCATTPCAAS